MRILLHYCLAVQIFCLLPCKIYASAQQSHKFFLKDIVYEGGNRLSAKQKQRFTSKYINKKITADDISNIIRDVTNHYVECGYITTSVTLPKQNLKDGLLRLAINEGYIENIEFDGQAPSNNSLAIKGDAALNLRDIEQSFDNLNLLRSNSPNIYIKPGDNKGGSIVVVENTTDKSWHLGAGAHNNGSQSKGKIGSSTSFSLENILGLSEYYTFGYRFNASDPRRRKMSSYTGIFAIPFGYNFLSCSYNKSLYRNKIKAELNDHISKGHSDVFSASFSRVVHRDQKSKTSVEISGGIENHNNYIDDYKINLSTYKTNKLTLGLNHQRRLASSVLSFGLKVTKGINHYKQKIKAAKFPRRIYSKLNSNLFWHKPISDQRYCKDQVAYNLQIISQLTPHILTPTEKYSLSSQAAVRGYKDYAENVDNGLCVRNELALDMTNRLTGNLASWLGKVSSFAAFDYGAYYTQGDFKDKSGILTGVACGLRSTGGVFVFDITFAKPLEIHQASVKPEIVTYLSCNIEV